METGQRLLNFSRPVIYTVVISFYLAGWGDSSGIRAASIIALAFFLVTTAIIVGWVPAPEPWSQVLIWLEILVAGGLNYLAERVHPTGALSILIGISLVTIFLRLTRRQWLPATLLAVGSWLIATAPDWWGKPGGPWAFLVIYLSFFLFTGSAGLLVRNLQFEQERSRQLLAEVTEAQGRLERALRQLQATAFQEQELQVLAERQRLAREIHDSVGHSLTGALVQLQAARRSLDRDLPGAVGLLNRAEEATRKALQETRRAVRALHPAGLEEQGDLAALIRLGRDFGAATGMEVTVTADPAVAALPPDPRRVEQIYRIFQECLTNAHRHGNAHRVAVHLAVMETELAVRVANDGLAPVDWSPGLGMKAMQERARSLGGSVRFDREPTDNWGLVVTVTLPIGVPVVSVDATGGSAATPLPTGAAPAVGAKKEGKAWSGW